jgi:hypothetical protein
MVVELDKGVLIINIFFLFAQVARATLLRQQLSPRMR